VIKDVAPKQQRVATMGSTVQAMEAKLKAKEDELHEVGCAGSECLDHRVSG